MTSTRHQLVPNGKPIAALMAAGMGSASLGILTILAEVSPKMIKPALNFYDPVGPLSGKTSVAVLIYFMGWLILNTFMKKRELDETFWLKIIFGLVLFGLLTTFPPFYQLFTQS